MDSSHNTIYNINMSPLLSNRFEEYEKNIMELKDTVNKINQKLDLNTKLLEESLVMLHENRKVYLEALNKIQQTEDKEIKPMINKLTTNMYLPTIDQRLLNRVWRMHTCIPGIIGNKDSNLLLQDIHINSGFLNMQTLLKK
jgi:hypothetical protein